MKKSIFILIIIGIIGGLIVSSISSSSSPDRVDISSEEFKQKLAEERGVIIDVRTKAEYNEGHLADTDLQFDFLNGEFEEQLDQMDTEKTYYLYCRTGNRSGKGARIMQERGFTNVYNAGGYEDLVSDGFEPQIPQTGE